MKAQHWIKGPEKLFVGTRTERHACNVRDQAEVAGAHKKLLDGGHQIQRAKGALLLTHHSQETNPSASTREMKGKKGDRQLGYLGRWKNTGNKNGNVGSWGA